MKFRWFEKVRIFFAGCLSRHRKTPGMKLGAKGESAAARFLHKCGWKIVTRNWRNGRDEIDIVAKDADTLVFVEVKTHSSVRATPTHTEWRTNGYYDVDKRKRRALARACRAYMQALARPPAQFRFDIIEVALHPVQPPEITHHRSIPLFPPHFRS
jgi:putative endonuclease